MRKIVYQCVFCKEDIETNPSQLVLVINGGSNDERSQVWFCHPECFTKTTGERVDILDDDEDTTHH